MTVIEADGQYYLLSHNADGYKLKLPRGIAHEPYTVNSIPVLTGQRYSVVVSINVNF